MALYRRISRLAAIALFSASLLIASANLPQSAALPPSIEWSVSLKDPDLCVLSVRGKVIGRTGRKFSFLAGLTGRGGAIEPIGMVAEGTAGRKLGIGETGSGWEIDCRGEDFSISYDVVLTIEDRYSPEVRGMLSRLGPGRSRLMGRDIFIQPAAPVAGGIVVDFGIYEGGAVESSWPNNGSRLIVPCAADLQQTLVASGDWRFLETSAQDVGLVLAIGGRWSFGDEELLQTLRDVVHVEIAMMGGSPREKHLVICDGNPVRGGAGFDYYGAQIGGSILLLLDPRMDRSELFGLPMSIVAHEFFHIWNGETLRPEDESFMWFTEGATVYYSYVVLLEAGIISRQQYDSAASTMERRYVENPLRGSIALTGAGNSDLSDREMVNLLYDGGFLAARAIDERIEAATGGGSGLIDVIRRLYQENPEGADIGPGDLSAAILAETGLDLSGYIGSLISGNLSLTDVDVSS